MLYIPLCAFFLGIFNIISIFTYQKEKKCHPSFFFLFSTVGISASLLGWILSGGGEREREEGEEKEKGKCKALNFSATN